MIFAIETAAPVFALVALGWLLRAFVFRAESFWESVETLGYFVLFPALLVASIASGPRLGPGTAVALGAVAGVAVAVASSLVLLRARLGFEGPTFTSLFQGAVRFNPYVGLAIAAAAYGPNGTAVVAVALALMIPLATLMSIAVLARHTQPGAANWTTMLVALSGNPLILASLLGIALNLVAFDPPPVTGPMLDLLGRAALAVGLLAVGAGLEFKPLPANWRALALAAAMKLVVSPALAWAAVHLAGLDATTAAAVVLFAALPTAPSALILARRFGGDHELMASAIAVQTVLAALTLPVVLALGG